MGTRRDRLIPEHTARHDEPHGRVSAFHFPNLNRTGVGPEQDVWISLYEEGVLHVAGRVLWREVEPTEDVPIVLNFRAFRHGKAHVLKNLDNFPTHHLQGMVCAKGQSAGGPGGIFSRGFRLSHSRLLCLAHLVLHGLLQGIQHGTQFPLLVTGHLLESGHQILHFPFAAQVGNAERLHRFRCGQCRVGHLSHQGVDLILHDREKGMFWLNSTVSCS